MRLLLKNHIENAMEALGSNRLRTALTITGVTIGTASIALVLSLSGGAAAFLSHQIARIDGSIAIVRPSTPVSVNNILSDAHSLPVTSVLTEKDAIDLAKIPDIKISPMSVLHTSLRAKEATTDGNRTALIGSNSALQSIADLEMAEGQFITNDTGVNGIVIGNQLAIDLLGTETAVGSVVRARGESFTVIGVLKPTNRPVNHLGVDFDRSAIVTVASLKQFTQQVAQVQQIIIAADNNQVLAKSIEKAQTILLENHFNEKDFVILTGKAITAPSSQLFYNSSMIIVAIAGVALLVGGIGIMNIMLVNVAERSREVGIRKAIGATNWNIVSQFLIESTLIGASGGLLGYLFGMATAYALAMYLPFGPALEWRTASISIGVATVTGVVFGIYPAIRAAAKDPIAALN